MTDEDLMSGEESESLFDVFGAAREIIQRVMEGSPSFEAFEIGRKMIKREGDRRAVHYIEIRDKGKIPLRIEVFTIEPIPLVVVDVSTRDFEEEGSIMGNPSVVQEGEEGADGRSIVD